MSKPLTAYVNGSFVPLADDKVHIEDRGFQFVDSVYKVIGVVELTVLEFQEVHLNG